MMMWQSCNEDNDKGRHCLVFWKREKKKKKKAAYLKGKQRAQKHKRTFIGRSEGGRGRGWRI